MSKSSLAILIGCVFGFVRSCVGASNPKYIIGLLRQSRLHLMKTMLLVIGVSSTLMFAGLMTDVLDAGHLGVKTAHAGVLLGGIMLGVGFAASGYCPGTGLAAAATGRKDAWLFVLGGLAGTASLMASYAWVASTGILSDWLGGKVTLGVIAGLNYQALLTGIPGAWIGIGVGLVLIAIAVALPNALRGHATGKSHRPADGELVQ